MTEDLCLCQIKVLLAPKEWNDLLCEQSNGLLVRGCKYQGKLRQEISKHNNVLVARVGLWQIHSIHSHARFQMACSQELGAVVVDLRD